MKKVLLLIAIILVGCFGKSHSQNKGDFIVGVNLGVSPSISKDVKVTNFGFGANAMYHMSRIVRVGLGLEYWVPSNTNVEAYHLESGSSYGYYDFKTNIFDITANIDFVIKVGNKFSFIPTIGIGYANLSQGLVIPDFYGRRSSGFVAQGGLGAEYRITDHIGVNLRVRFQNIMTKIEDESRNNRRIPITAGISYNF